MVKREEYENFLKNYDFKVKTCFMGHNAEWTRIRNIERKCSNFTFDTFGNSTNYLQMFKSKVANDYDLIILDSSRIFNTYEFERMKKQALSISGALDKRVTVAYSSYIDKSNGNSGLLQQILFYSVKNEEILEEVIPISYEEQLLFDVLDLLVIALDKHREYNNQKQFKK